MNVLGKWRRMIECWGVLGSVGDLRCSKVVMASPAERGNGIPTPKCIPSGKHKFKMSR